MSEPVEELLEYLIKWDVASFFHLSVDSMYTCSLWYFSALLGFKIGIGFFRNLLDI